MEFTEESKVKRCHEYMEALEEERRKIQVFQRELPLSLDLINQAIENCRQQLEAEQTTSSEEEKTTSSNEGPVLEEFIPLKRTPSSSDFKHLNNNKSSNNNETKVDWMKSVQLWNQNPDPVLKQDLPRKTAAVVIETKKIGGAFHPFHKSTEISSTPTATTTTTTTTTITPPSSMTTSSTTEKTVDEGDEQNHKSDTNNNRRDEKERQSSSSRKTRRCWSPELHRRFLHALQQLGGSHVATPKQIRELMKVDGLTNDEVKSHLQKYRLHTRRPSSGMHNNGNTQTPQFVVVGGIWVPPQEYSTAVTAKASDSTHGNSSNGIYAPVALQPQAPPPIFPHQKPQQQQSPTGPLHSSEEGRSSRAEHSILDNDDDNDVVNCRSPSMSSSTTHTSTASLTL